MHFIQLIRPINLAIMVLTMYGIRFYILSANYFQKITDNSLDFGLLVVSTVLIAAAGNIINDYFDVKADRINKPEKLIITKHIKRRWAIVIHWAFNGIAFGIALYLSIAYQSLWFVFVHLLSINLLWFYSMLFKRKIVIGNLIIAGLTALVPLLVLIFYKVNNTNYLNFSEFNPDSWSVNIDYRMVYFLAFFAFVQNLAREIIKDAQDVKGDKLIYVTSLPMVLGEKKTLYIVCGILSILPIFYVWSSLQQMDLWLGTSQFFIQSLPFLIAALLNLVIIYLVFASKQVNLKLYNNLIKLSMFFGIMAPFYLAIFYTIYP